MPAIVRLTKLTLLITATCFLVIFLIWAAFVRSGSLAVLGQMCQWIGVLLIGTGLLSLTGEWTVERNPPYQYPESAGESMLVKKKGSSNAGRHAPAGFSYRHYRRRPAAAGSRIPVNPSVEFFDNHIKSQLLKMPEKFNKENLP
jgi:hypothetical protein